MESKGNRNSAWVEPQQQLGAYVAWVNSQLKKKPGVHLIEDLRNDMRDGVVFADIIEIVAKEQVKGIYEVPATYEEMRHNIELVLKFMTSHHIKMHRIRVTDIVEGHLKAIMRLILALAAHYKPMSVRHSTHSSSSHSSSSHSSSAGHRRQSVMDIAQGASAALTEARRNAKKAGRRSSRYVESSSDACSDGDPQGCEHQDSQRRVSVSVRMETLSPERGELEGCSDDNSPVTSPRSSLYMQGASASDMSVLSPHSKETDNVSVDSGLPAGWDDGHVEVVKDLKKQLLQLQELMIENGADSGMDGDGGGGGGAASCPPDAGGDGGGGGGCPSVEDWVLVRSQLQQVTIISQELREELSMLRNHCLQLQGTKAGLQQRLGEQDAMLSQLKSDKLNLEIELQTTAAENASLHRQLKSSSGQWQGEDVGEKTEARDQAIAYLREELARKERMVGRLHQELMQQQHHQHQDHSSPSSVTLRHSSVHMPPPSLLSLPQQELLGDEETASPDRNVTTPDHRPVSMPPTYPAGREIVGGDVPRTTVLYFSDYAQKPVVCAIAGRLGEIRLRDFKKLFEDSDKYRYYFKALDPEYGTVREELTKEDAVVPGWEDKIVAWVETETGTPC